MPNEFRVKRGLIVETTGSASGSNVVTVDGVAGRLFTVVDTFSGSLFSVNTVAGLPVIEAFSDNTVRIGQFGQRALFVSQSRVGFGKETGLNAKLDVSGSTNITGSLALLVSSSAPNTIKYTAQTQFGWTGTWTLGYDGNGFAIDPGDRTIAIYGQGSAGYLYGTIINSIGRWGVNTTDNNILDDHILSVNGSLYHLRAYNRQTGNYTLALSDASKIVEMNVGSANNLTVPPSSSADFPTGSFIDVIQYGAGQTTFVTGSGVTIRSANGWLKMNARYGAATLTKIGGNEWYLVGNLSA